MTRFTFAVLLALGLLTACRDETTPVTTTGGGEGGGDGDGDGDGGSSSKGSGGDDVPGGPLKVMNWNVRNMFDTQRDSTNEGEEVLTPTQYDFELDRVASTIAALAPQVIVLAEVENQAILDDLAGRAGPQYIARHLINGNDPRGIDVGIISTIPIDSAVSHAQDSFALEGTQAPTYQFTRDLPEFHITYGGEHLVFLAVHFRSKAGDDLPQKRLAEAQRARVITDQIAAADPDAAIFLLGDFNDLPGSAPIEHVRQRAPAFLDATDFVALDERWSFLFQDSKELIDHQFANPIAAAWLDQASVAFDRSGPAETASDHAPFVATYNVP